jgi:predicted CoA-binding protein
LEQKSIQEILATCKTIAIVGLSREPKKESHKVASYMLEHGYRIIPINPLANKVLREKSYNNLSAIPRDIKKRIDIVNIFRPAEDVPPIVDEALRIKEESGKPFVIWMQLGKINEQASEKARKAGLTVIMDKCIMKEHRQLFS